MLGFSIYLNKAIDKKTENYIQNMSKNGFEGIFTSIHIPEDDTSEYKSRVFQLGKIAKKNHLKLMADIDDKSLKILDLTIDQADKLKEKGITGLRVDANLSLGQIARLSHKIEIGLNASTITEEELKKLIINKANTKNMQAWFNYYPCPETGMSRAFFLEKIELMKKYGFKTQAFFSGNENLRGPLYEGLPTLEYQRYYCPLAAIIELKKMGIDLVYLGDGGIKKESVDQILSYKNKNQIIIHVKRQVNSDLYKYCLGSHQQRFDPAELVVRCVDSRMHKVPLVEKQNTVSRNFGSVTINNKNYLRYMGEIQITKKDLPENQKVNVVGQVVFPDLPLVNLIEPGQKFELISEK